MSKFKVGDKVVLNVINATSDSFTVTGALTIGLVCSFYLDELPAPIDESKLKFARCSQYEEHHEPAEIVETEIAMALITLWDRAWNQVLSIKQK